MLNRTNSLNWKDYLLYGTHDLSCRFSSTKTCSAEVALSMISRSKKDLDPLFHEFVMYSITRVKSWIIQSNESFMSWDVGSFFNIFYKFILKVSKVEPAKSSTLNRGPSNVTVYNCKYHIEYESKFGLVLSIW